MSDANVKTIAVIDLETNDLPLNQNNTCGITELSIYAFPAKCFGEENIGGVSTFKLSGGMRGIENLVKEPPDLPRVLHKLTMMVNPERKITPVPAKLTGLTNDMLVNESPFNTNTANCLLSFLERLENPICLVAHNGWKFDFPVVRYVLAQISKSMPSTIFCIDSFHAFCELDKKQAVLKEIGKSFFEQEQHDKMAALNEYRTAFSKPFQEIFPKKGLYVLGNIFERIFKQPPGKLHCAEADVAILTKIIISYGLPFLAYIEQRKKFFGEVPNLGTHK